MYSMKIEVIVGYVTHVDNFRNDLQHRDTQLEYVDPASRLASRFAALDLIGAEHGLAST